MSVLPSPLPPLRAAPLRALRSRLRLSIRDAGLTDLHHHAHETDRPFWELEPSPLVIPADEWTLLEAALRQRARYVNALLADLYSDQQALHRQIIPPEIIFADPYYRRPCLHLEPNRLQPATLLRFDLIKTATGWCFTDTRANTPIGLSYAVQNRRFMTQEAAALYRSLPDYQSVINFPLQLLEALRALAPDPHRAPSIVVLTAGPQDPFYSEHSFLARKMGLPLARGDDLLVLDNRLYFKTVSGLERVDVLYRRLNDAHIDPVVFSTDRETAGIPGLLHCIRTRHVVVANAIGTGLADSRAFDAYVPRLLRFYLGEKPLLPTLPTYTCGDNDQLDYILEHRAELIVRPVHDPRLGDARATRPGPPLLDRKGLARSVRAHPHAFVAQPRETGLGFDPTARRPTPFQLTCFVLCSPQGQEVFPGGLVRLGPPSADRLGKTADALVLIDRDRSSRAIADAETSGNRRGTLHTLGSRAAENLFWLGRYLERAEATARMLSILDDVALEEIPPRERRRWLPIWRGLLEATGHAGHKITARASPQQTLSTDLMWRMTLERGNSSSIYSSINWAVENARQLRDIVTPEVWTILSRLGTRLDELRALGPGTTRTRQALTSLTPGPASLAVSAVLDGINAFLGLAERTLLQDSGWHFLRLGLHLERATMTCGALRHVLTARDTRAAAQHPGDAHHFRDNPELSALLRMLGSQDAYRRLYQTRSKPRFVAELFLQQPEAPRSIYHNLLQIQASLLAIRRQHHTGPTAHPDSASDPVHAAVRQSLAFLDAVQLGSHFDSDRLLNQAEATRLSDTLNQLLDHLYGLHPLFSDHYFSHQAHIAPPVLQPELPLT